MDLVDKQFGDILVIEYVGDDHYLCKCDKCGESLHMSEIDIGIDSNGCILCKRYKFNLEESKVIYDLHNSDDVSVVDLADRYKCSRYSIYNILKRIEATTTY